MAMVMVIAREEMAWWTWAFRGETLGSYFVVSKNVKEGLLKGDYRQNWPLWF